MKAVKIRKPQQQLIQLQLTQLQLTYYQAVNQMVGIDTSQFLERDPNLKIFGVGIQNLIGSMWRKDFVVNYTESVLQWKTMINVAGPFLAEITLNVGEQEQISWYRMKWAVINLFPSDPHMKEIELRWRREIITVF